VIHFLTHHPYALLIVLVWGAAGLILWNEKRKAVLVDSYGLPIDPDFDADIEQAIANVAKRTGHIEVPEDELRGRSA
jgi:hypothetical protein